MRNAPQLSIIGLIALLFTLVAPADVAAQSTPAAFSCPVTEPGEERPTKHVDPFAADDSLIHEDGLWVTIPENGVLRLRPDDLVTFGPVKDWRTTKVTWLREEGVEGFVTVSGQRLDEPSDLAPTTPLSPQRQYVKVGPVTTGLAFPEEGCWEVTGSVGDHEITFVVEVRFVEESTPATEPCPYCRPGG